MVLGFLFIRRGAMSAEDEFKLLVGAYFGIQEMDEYKLKEYVLKDLEEYIKDFLKLHSLSNINLKEMAEEIKDKLPLKRKLQDGLIALRKIDGPLDLILMMKEKINELNEN